MEGQPLLPESGKTNGLAVTSLILGIVGWVIALALLCLNVVIVPLTLATMGIGAILYVCTAAVGCLSPLSWLGTIITGHVAKNKIKETGEKGNGQATAGLIMGYIGLGLTIVGTCVFAVLVAVGTITLPSLNYPSY